MQSFEFRSSLSQTLKNLIESFLIKSVLFLQNINKTVCVNRHFIFVTKKQVCILIKPKGKQDG